MVLICHTFINIKAKVIKWFMIHLFQHLLFFKRVLPITQKSIISVGLKIIKHHIFCISNEQTYRWSIKNDSITMRALSTERYETRWHRFRFYYCMRFFLNFSSLFWSSVILSDKNQLNVSIQFFKQEEKKTHNHDFKKSSCNKKWRKDRQTERRDIFFGWKQVCQSIDIVRIFLINIETMLLAKACKRQKHASSRCVCVWACII